MGNSYMQYIVALIGDTEHDLRDLFHEEGGQFAATITTGSMEEA